MYPSLLAIMLINSLPDLGISLISYISVCTEKGLFGSIGNTKPKRYL